MDIKKLITDLQVCADDDILCTACERFHTADCANQLLRDAAEALTELFDENDNLQQRVFILRELAPKQKWIPVTERLPENFVSVLGYMPASSPFPPVRECYIVGNAFFFPALNDTQMVTYWMPLPEPPREDSL